MARILNTDTGFGIWSVERVRSELIEHLVTPKAASLLYYKDQLVGFNATFVDVTRTPKTGTMTWLSLLPAHRNKGLGRALFLHTTGYFSGKGYEKIIFTTDPYRLKAIGIYLSEGAVPVYNALSAIVSWWVIKRRLRRLTEDRVRSRRGMLPSSRCLD